MKITFEKIEPKSADEFSLTWEVITKVPGIYVAAGYDKIRFVTSCTPNVLYFAGNGLAEEAAAGWSLSRFRRVTDERIVIEP